MSVVVIPNRPAGSSPRAIADILANFDAITAFLNGQNLDPDNLSAAFLQKAGVSDSAVVRRGKSIIAAAGSRTNVAYGALDNGPDRVSSVVLPADGLIFVGYRAEWLESNNLTANAAIFIGANQLRRSTVGSNSPGVQEAGSPNPGAAGLYAPLASWSGGLVSDGGGLAYTGDVTTGQIVGHGTNFGVCPIFAAAGTYDISVQFKSSAGLVSVKNRKLWVWTMSF